MKVVNDYKAERFLADLDRLDDRQARIQREISSGFRVNKPSDAPEELIDILQLRSDVERATQIGTNLQRVSAEVNTAEAAVRVSVQLLERARTIAAQTATDTATNRTGIALEVRELHQQLVDITRTISEGRYVFSGDVDNTPLYGADWTKPGGINPLATTANTRQIEDVNGSRFSVAQIASQLFDARNSDGTMSVNNVFNAVYQLGKALEADDRSAVEASAALISTSLDHLGRSLTFYGNVQNRISNAETLTQNALIARKTELSERQDTDMPNAIIELSTVKTHREAALGAQAQQPRSTLFDYLA